MEPKKVDGWNVAELAGGLLLSADDFSVQFDTLQVDKLIDILNSDKDGQIRDNNGDLVTIEPKGADSIILTRVNDKAYPNGIIVPVDVFSEFDEEDDAQVSEGVKPVWRRVGSKIKRGFRVTSGFRKGRIVSSPAGANKPRAKASTRAKLSRAGHRKTFIRAMKAKLTRKKPASIKLRRLNEPKRSRVPHVRKFKVEKH